MKSAQITVELVDGQQITARTVMRDMNRYEDVAKKQKPPWGTISESPAKWESFVSWSAVTREGKWEGTLEQWIDAVASIEFEFDEVRPTNGASLAGI